MQKKLYMGSNLKMYKTIEETVKREVKEETGIDVTDLKYYKCQPWSFSSPFAMFCLLITFP